MLQLEGESIVLREFTETNLNDPKYFGWLRDLEVVTPIYRLEYLMPIQFQEVEKYVHLLFSSKNDCFFAVYRKDTDEFIGTQRIGHIDWRTGIGDIGILIGDKKSWGKGFATQAVGVACKYAFSVLSLRKLTGGTPETNVAMCKCFEHIGFQQEGRLRKQLLINGEYYDHIFFGLLKDYYRELERGER
jgi:[ribosomal protein S5]-alanine N-acetyltransferase